jgi:flagellar biosynthesis protein FlhG
MNQRKTTAATTGNKAPIIIPIAGGKGGVGKSFLTANLAVALALRGHSTIAVDLDLGNSNLHSLLGLENRYAGIGEFLRGTIKCRPEEMIVKTSVPGLGFIAGDGRMPFMANIDDEQKKRLIKFLKRLPARYVLLDLSAGTSLNTLDLFLSADSGILVTTPEYPAIMNMLVFAKNLALHAINRSLKDDPSLAETLDKLRFQSVNDNVFTVERLRQELAVTHPDAAAKVESLCRRIRPRLVYNMVEDLEDIEIFARVGQTLAEILSIECDHIGLISYDLLVRRSMRQPGIFQTQNPASQTVERIDRIAQRIELYWDQPIKGSAELLANYARAVLRSSAATDEALSS